MSSPPGEKTDTKAGHLPAVKAGGMRIVQKHPHTPHGDIKEDKKQEDENWESGIVQPKPPLVISGAIARVCSYAVFTLVWTPLPLPTSTRLRTPYRLPGGSCSLGQGPQDPDAGFSAF
ncbi:death-associated protein 1 isoform X1 [Ranitomeya variabilis]|uniref:death-associated protein 1 isoform X1 n=1 Tax=Ranitomeya variabilis TaxID=490064 RepID=UPI0040561F8A